MKSTTTIVNAVLDEFFADRQEDTPPGLARAFSDATEYAALRGLVARAVELARSTAAVTVNGQQRSATDVLRAEAAIANEWATHVGVEPEQVDWAAVAHNLGRAAETMRLVADALQASKGDDPRGYRFKLAASAVAAEHWQWVVNAADESDLDTDKVFAALRQASADMHAAADAL